MSERERASRVHTPVRVCLWVWVWVCRCVFVRAAIRTRIACLLPPWARAPARSSALWRAALVRSWAVMRKRTVQSSVCRGRPASAASGPVSRSICPCVLLRGASVAALRHVPVYVGCYVPFLILISNCNSLPCTSRGVPVRRAVRSVGIPRPAGEFAIWPEYE